MGGTVAGVCLPPPSNGRVVVIFVASSLAGVPVQTKFFRFYYRASQSVLASSDSSLVCNTRELGIRHKSRRHDASTRLRRITIPWIIILVNEFFKFLSDQQNNLHNQILEIYSEHFISTHALDPSCGHFSCRTLTRDHNAILWHCNLKGTYL
jgi:hypothetical protein